MQKRELKKFDIRNLPPEGHLDVGKFFWDLWSTAVAEKTRLGLEDKFIRDYRLWRGGHWDQAKKMKQQDNKVDKLTANLLFANIQRTVANITARAPIAEVVSLDGGDDVSDQALSAQVRKWNNESEQSKGLSSSVLGMEIYGITIEKAVYNPKTEHTTFVVLDPFAYAPAPGYYADLNDMPYQTHHYPMACEDVEAVFNAEKGSVSGESALSMLGTEREDHRPIPTGTTYGSQNYPGNFTDVQHPHRLQEAGSAPALVVEIWARDYTMETVQTPAMHPDTGEPVVNVDGTPYMNKQVRHKYPGGIRAVTLTNRGDLVLADRPNPNINNEIPRELTQHTYLFDNFPFYKSNSYEDGTSIWGFSSADQVGDLNLKIDEMVTRLSQYLGRIMLPTLILPKDSGVKLSDLNNKPGLVLQPRSGSTSTGIRYLETPNLPASFFEALNWYITLFDRISQIEDADRGVAPSGVIAAQAIVALQERGAVLVQAKIRAVDYLVRQRGRCAISFFQNFGQEKKMIDVQGDPVIIQGIQFLGRSFNYVVESGSTVARTSLQIQEQSMELYKLDAIDRQALLENLNYPGWKEIIERVGEGQLNNALQILIQAGLPEETAMELSTVLMEKQGGPGDTKQGRPSTAPPQQGEVNA